MHSTLTRTVAAMIIEDRVRHARSRAHQVGRPPRSPGPVRRSAAVAASRVARRLDAEAARRTMAA